jgi:hypothetical protein
MPPVIFEQNKSDFYEWMNEWMNASKSDFSNGNQSPCKHKQIFQVNDTTKQYLQVLSVVQDPCNKHMGKCTVKCIGTLQARLLHQVDTANQSKSQKHPLLFCWYESWSSVEFVPPILSFWNDFPTKTNHDVCQQFVKNREINKSKSANRSRNILYYKFLYVCSSNFLLQCIHISMGISLFIERKGPTVFWNTMTLRWQIINCTQVWHLTSYTEQIACIQAVDSVHKKYFQDDLFYNVQYHTIEPNKQIFTPFIMWIPVTTAWCVLGLWTEEMASRYGRYLQLQWMSSHRQPIKGGSPIWGLGKWLVNNFSP